VLPENTEQAEVLTPAGPALRRGLLLAAGVILLVGVSLLAVALSGDEGDGELARHARATHTFVVPAGAGERADRGEVLLDVFPDRLDAFVGDRIVITNADDRLHVLGPFSIRPGETIDYEFTEPGTFRGACTIHGINAEAVIEVR
jgi:plastocyanin